VNSGFSHEGVSILASDARGEYADDAVKAAGIGAVIGGLGLIAGLGALAIPGIGLLVAAAPYQAH
jgi:hypothetical protein